MTGGGKLGTTTITMSMCAACLSKKDGVLTRWYQKSNPADSEGISSTVLKLVSDGIPKVLLAIVVCCAGARGGYTTSPTWGRRRNRKVGSGKWNGEWKYRIIRTGNRKWKEWKRTTRQRLKKSKVRQERKGKERWQIQDCQHCQSQSWGLVSEAEEERGRDEWHQKSAVVGRWEEHYEGGNYREGRDLNGHRHVHAYIHHI